MVFLLERWRKARAQTRMISGGVQGDRQPHDSGIKVADVPTLTDDYAPTDALLLLD